MDTKSKVLVKEQESTGFSMQASVETAVETSEVVRKKVWDYPATTAKEQGLADIRVTIPQIIRQRARQDNPEEEGTKTLCYVNFSIVGTKMVPALDKDGKPTLNKDGKPVLVNQRIRIIGCRVKQKTAEDGPFLSRDGFIAGDGENRRWMNIVGLDEEQCAFLVRYAMREIEKAQLDRTDPTAV